MLATNRSRPTPDSLGTREVAELLAALVAARPALEAAVRTLAPRTADAVLAELDAIAGGALAPRDASAAVRWILPELHRELGRPFRAARA